MRLARALAWVCVVGGLLLFALGVAGVAVGWATDAPSWPGWAGVATSGALAGLLGLASWSCL